MRILRAFTTIVCVVFLVTALESTPLRTIAYTPTCSQLIRERNASFNMNKADRDNVRRQRKNVAQLREKISTDETEINMLSGVAEAKQLENSKARLADKKAKLKSEIHMLDYVEAAERRSARILQMSDEEVQRCSGKKTTPSVNMNGQWAGNWNDGNWTYYHIFSGPGSLSYSYQNNAFGGSSGGQGRCTVNGNVATCTWTGHLSSDAPNRERSGHSTLTLSTFRDDSGVEHQYILMHITDDGPPLPYGMSNVSNIRLDRTK